MNKGKIIIWGAGTFGERAIKRYGEENIAFFIDSSEEKVGKKFHGFLIKSFEDYLNDNKLSKYALVLAMSSFYAYEVEEKLKENGIENYTFYYENFLKEDKIVVDNNIKSKTESEWNEEVVNNQEVRERISSFVEKYKNDVPFIKEIEIETINRCNGVCTFCPVNRNIDQRPLKKMDENLFKKIIDELSDLKYRGRIALFSNNEPFMDNRIIDFSKYTREKLPLARIHLFTNGTLLSLDKFTEIINYLDELIIDNYNNQNTLTNNAQEIERYIENHEELTNKVGICLRNTTDVLSSRGGDAPNRNNIIDYREYTCALPFQQLVIRPSGEISLCCNDPLGKETLGNLNDESIIDIWYGEKYKKLRNDIAKGRFAVKHCTHCDTFMHF